MERITITGPYPGSDDTLELRVYLNRYGLVVVSTGHVERARDVELSRAEARKIAMALLKAAEG